MYQFPFYKSNHSPQGGFTLVELLLYITIASVLLFSVAMFVTHIFTIREKSRIANSVDMAGMHALQVITQKVRNASGIVEPTVGQSSTTLDIAEGDDTFSFFEQSGRIWIEDDEGSQDALTPLVVEISDFTARNASREDTPGVVDVSFRATFLVGENVRREFTYEKEFSSSAAVRPQ